MNSRPSYAEIRGDRVRQLYYVQSFKQWDYNIGVRAIFRFVNR